MKKKSLPSELTGAANVVEDFNARIEALEENFGDNEKIAKILCTVSDNIKDFDKLFEKAFVNLIKNSTDIKQAFQSFVDMGDRKVVYTIFKRFGVIIGWILSLAVTALITALITKSVN